MNGCVIFYPHGWDHEKKEGIAVNFMETHCGEQTSWGILPEINEQH